MKKLLLILVCLPMLFTISSCSEEEQEDNSVSNMVGIWNASSLILDGIDYTAIPGVESIDFIMNSNMTFSQRTLVITGEIQSLNGTWELNESDLFIYFDTEEFVHYYINSFTSNTASLNLVEYLNDDNDPAYSSGSCNLVKQ